MKRFLFLTLLFIPAIAQASYDAYINGIYYNFVKKQAIVSTKESVLYESYDNKEYSGEVVIPSTITHEGVSYTVTKIGDHAFYNCHGLKKVTLPPSITSIEGQAFYNCDNLSSINIPDSLISIGEFSFYKCSSLTTIEIPNTTTTIGNYAFSECKSLKKIEVGENISQIGNNAFSVCISLESIKIPNNIKTIKYSTFSNCVKLCKIEIPNSVTCIESSAFSYCRSLTDIIIGSGVNSIGDFAFGECENLETITCLAINVPYADESAFGGAYIEDAVLKVPLKSIDSYSSSEPWKNFGKIEAAYDNSAEKCAKPLIQLIDGQIVAKSETDGADCYISYIISNDASGVNTLSPNIILEVSSYAVAEGYAKSDVSTEKFYYSRIMSNYISQLNESKSELETAKNSLSFYTVCDLNKDGKTDIDDVAYLLQNYYYTGKLEDLANLTEDTSISLCEIKEKFGDIEFYTLDGMKVVEPSMSGIYIIRKNGETKMIIVKK